MPLKLTSFNDKGQVAALNRWADGIETQQRATESLTLFVNQGVQTLMNTPTTTSSSVTVGPGFIFYVTPTDNIAISNFISGVANNVGGILFYLPTQISTTEIQFYVAQADAANTYDVGIYGPFTGSQTSVPLLANTGPLTYAVANTQVTSNWLQGSVKLAPGYYFINWTSSNTGVLLQLQGLYASQYLYAATSATTTSASTLPSSVLVPTRTPTILNTGVGGNNRPNWFNFNLA
jgi:hypothetical protein